MRGGTQSGHHQHVNNRPWHPVQLIYISSLDNTKLFNCDQIDEYQKLLGLIVMFLAHNYWR